MSQRKQLLLLTAATVVLAIVIGAVLWLYYKNGILARRSPENIALLFEEGQFHEALKGLQHLPEDDAGRQQLERFMAVRVLPDARFQFQRQGEPPSRLFGLQDPEIQNLSLTNEDNYRLQIFMPEDGPPNYLYVFQVDQDGKVHNMFPNPIYSNMVNPVSPGSKVHMPQSEADWLFYLVSPSQDSPKPVSETIYVVASPWRARDLEGFFEKDSSDDLKKAPQEMIKAFKERIHLRETAGIASVYVESFTFGHAGQ